ncbi:UDP-2-acetamido-2,6-beta-L-arabino-hexul-4-ose reductase [Nocardioides perillae]|uniref:UDP-2-acetamido-2,6-beta-L-arabino-hexul-4-ose reductase n=1 Tax=Nocardioides perillae TaxID=1119534 RepID=A0A7Y9RQJ3_9ACTN|nr:UDP-2-acetamido-2,6-beta-L-arabino-hexul-4-ose reductase [Nocardioides perillae]
MDTVLHVAGVNRAGSDAEVERGNLDAAASLAAAVRETGRPVDVVYANSIQAQLDNAYGRGKSAAAALLSQAVAASGGRFADLLLPNLFGEHGRPGYNSFVATFAHEVAAGRRPTVTGDREVPLLHAQRAAAELIGSIGRTERRTVAGEPRGISEVLGLLEQTHALYATRGEVPPLPGKFEVDLFNTYRAAAFPQMWPLTPQVHADPRGELFETLRSHGGTGQAFVSTTRPGQSRGDHYHLNKVERFFIVRGEAEISLRRLLHDDVVTFRLSGERPSFVDMPTLWVHAIRNVGDDDLVTMFWADQLLDPESPDQYAEKVHRP